ncbi:MAG TPA: ABC transporter substrate-binding protein [Armatimonadota bacterium]|nr:ABC transporter substrate-binding protein [Armatimonadota bacterium]
MVEGYWGKYWRRRVSRRRILAGGATATVGAAGLVAVGCGDDDDDDDDAPAPTAAPTSTTAPGEPTSTPAPAATATAAPDLRGGTFHDSAADTDTGLDPQVTVTGHNVFHTALAYSHLLHYRLSVDEAFGDLATHWEQPDNTTMIFHLRDGVQFGPTVANGREMTAEDVKFSYDRFPHALNELGSEVNRLQTYFIETTEATDERTVTMKMGSPYASAIPSMGSSAHVVVEPQTTLAAGNNLADVMNAGSGSHMMTVRNDGGLYRWERNPNYYKHTPATGNFVEDGPYIDTWESITLSDSAALEARFISGDADVSRFGIDRFKAEELANEDGVVVYESPGNANSQFQMDAYKWAPHPELRRAVSLAIDRDAMIDIVYAGEGVYGSPVGPGFPMVLSQDELRELCPYDPTEAKRLWDTFGGDDVFPDGLKTVTATFSPQPHVEFVARQLQEVLGITVTQTPADLANYVSLATKPSPKDWDFFMASEGSLATIPDYNALTFYVPTGYGMIFGGLDPASEIPETAAYAQESLSRFGAQAALLDPEERYESLREYQRWLITNHCCSLPLPSTSITRQAFRERVQNVQPFDSSLGNASEGYRRQPNMWLDPTLS